MVVLRRVRIVAAAHLERVREAAPQVQLGHQLPVDVPRQPVGDVPRDARIAALAAGRAQRGGERAHRAVGDLGALPDAGRRQARIVARETEAVVLRLAGIEVDAHVLLRVQVVEGGLPVRVQPAHRPHDERLAVEPEVLVDGVGCGAESGASRNEMIG